MYYEGPERRAIRSDESYEVALTIFLHRARLRLGLDALVVADGQGRALAWSGEAVDPQAAAAHAAALYHEGTPLPGLEGQIHFAWEVEIDHAPAYVFAVGDPSDLSSFARDTSEGIARIARS